MAAPFTVSGVLTLLEALGAPAESLPFSPSGQYDSKVAYELTLPAAAGSVSLDFGTIPSAGCRALLLIYEVQTDAAPVQVLLNSSSVPLELSSGGVLLYTSPSPTAGITGMSVTHTTAGKLRVWILG